MNNISNFFRAAGSTMSSGLKTARQKMPSTETMRSSIVSGGAKLGRSLSKGAGSIRTGFENVKGGRRMQSAGEKAKAAGRSISKFCSTNWAKTANARGKVNDFFKELGFRHYNSIAEFFFRFPGASGSSKTELKGLIARQKSWHPNAVYQNKPLLKGMAKWAVAKRKKLPKGDVRLTSLNPILMLSDINQLELESSKDKFSNGFNALVDKYLPIEEAGPQGLFGSANTKNADSFEVNVNASVKSKAKELREISEGERDDDWKSNVMNFLKNDVIIGENGLDSQLVFSSRTEDNLSPVRYFLQENS